MKPFWALWQGTFSVRGTTADDREEKTSVRREGANGMPKFPRYAEI